MKPLFAISRRSVSLLLLLLCLATASSLLGQPVSTSDGVEWYPLSSPVFEVKGLPWFGENSPELYRFPLRAKADVPVGVWNRAVAPDGGRVRLRCNTSRFLVKVGAMQGGGKQAVFDVFIGDENAGTAKPKANQEEDLVLFSGKGRELKDITLYLPNNHQVQVLAIGVDRGSKFKKPHSFAKKLPMVCYGSSVLQGTGATHPAHTYPAAVARRLHLDFVNLGFGGAGKAEPAVVSLVNQLDACCYLFDLGKSYGNQGPEPFARMIDVVREKHPKVPIVCVTPIYSTKEKTEPGYDKRSDDLRVLMRSVALERQKKGDKNIVVVDGLKLFGPGDEKLFHDSLHPNDDGNERIADRLAPIIANATHLQMK